MCISKVKLRLFKDSKKEHKVIKTFFIFVLDIRRISVQIIMLDQQQTET